MCQGEHGMPPKKTLSHSLKLGPFFACFLLIPVNVACSAATEDQDFTPVSEAGEARQTAELPAPETPIDVSPVAQDTAHEATPEAAPPQETEAGPLDTATVLDDTARAVSEAEAPSAGAPATGDTAAAVNPEPPKPATPTDVNVETAAAAPQEPAPV